MKHIFLSFIYPIMRVLALAVILTSCGTLQTINGVRLPKDDEPKIKSYVAITVISFGFGYYLGKEVLPQKKN